MNVVELVRARAPEFAALPAVIERPGAEAELVRTHAELWARVDRLSSAFAALGLRKGDVVAAWLPDRAEAIEAELASLQSGLVWASFNTRYTWNETRELMADCEPRLLIADPEHLERIPPQASLPPLLLVEDARADSAAAAPPRAVAARYEEALAAASPEPALPRISPEDLARLRYTSGTTGRPKAAMLPHRVYLASLRNLQAELHPMDRDDRVLHVAPLTHASGAMMFPVLATGGANLLPRRPFDAGEALATIERERVTAFFAVPTILQRLVEHPDAATRDLSSLRTIFYGGAPTPPEKLEPVVRRLGPKLVHIFGMTEAPYPIATLRREEHWVGNPRLGSIGRPTAICEVKIVRDDGSEAEVGEIGELWIRGENVMSGYWRDEAETRRALRDGWLASGDLATRDAEGFLRIVDRRKDVIISGGFNVYAAEVEATIAAHPSVSEAAVVGLPHPDWGETVAAFVVPRAGATLDEESVKAWCRERLTGYKNPRVVRIVADLPRNAAGKVWKKALRDAAPSPQAPSSPQVPSPRDAPSSSA